MDFDIHILNLGAEITIFEDFIYVYIYEEQKETKQIHVFDFFLYLLSPFLYRKIEYEQ